MYVLRLKLDCGKRKRIIIKNFDDAVYWKKRMIEMEPDVIIHIGLRRRK